MFIASSFFVSNQEDVRSILSLVIKVTKFMEVHATLAISIILMICSFLVHQYAQKEVKFHIKVLTVLSWTICFFAYFLLPFDIYLVGLCNLGNS